MKNGYERIWWTSKIDRYPALVLKRDNNGMADIAVMRKWMEYGYLCIAIAPRRVLASDTSPRHEPCHPLDECYGLMS
jgi:hypothetical protein